MYEPRDLEHHLLTHWQPVQMPKHWYDVVTITGAPVTRRAAVCCATGGDEVVRR